MSAYSKGINKIKGISTLRHKESDRFATLKGEFGKLGVKIETNGDYMIIKGKIPEGGIVHSHNDHRIAMALAIAGLGSKGDIVIEQAQSVKKSYPDFYLDYEILGGITVNNL